MLRGDKAAPDRVETKKQLGTLAEIRTGYPFRGSIDRVDELPDGTQVASDYKLGSAAGNQDKLSVSSLGHKYVQLPIYLLALEAASRI